MLEVPWHPSPFPNALSPPQTAAQSHLRRPFAAQNCDFIHSLLPTGLFLHPQWWEHPQNRHTFPPTGITRVGRRRLHLPGSRKSVQGQGITELEAEYRGGLTAGELKGLWEVNRGKKGTRIIPIKKSPKPLAGSAAPGGQDGIRAEKKPGVVKRAEICCKSDKDAEVPRRCSAGTHWNGGFGGGQGRAPKNPLNNKNRSGLPHRAKFLPKSHPSLSLHPWYPCETPGAALGTHTCGDITSFWSLCICNVKRKKKLSFFSRLENFLPQKLP